MKSGKRVSASIPYGYRILPEDKQKLLVDDEAADVVRRIFGLVASGSTVKQVVNILTDDKVLIPSAYAEKNILRTAVATLPEILSNGHQRLSEASSTAGSTSGIQFSERR